MNFVEIIKRQLMDERSFRGYRQKTAVDTTALIELVEEYERMESGQRLQHTAKHIRMEPVKVLADALTHCYKTSSEAELMVFIMDVLKKLIKERRELERVKRAERGYSTAEEEHRKMAEEMQHGTFVVKL